MNNTSHVQHLTVRNTQLNLQVAKLTAVNAQQQIRTAEKTEALRGQITELRNLNQQQASEINRLYQKLSQEQAANTELEQRVYTAADRAIDAETCTLIESAEGRDQRLRLLESDKRIAELTYELLKVLHYLTLTQQIERETDAVHKAELLLVKQENRFKAGMTAAAVVLFTGGLGAGLAVAFVGGATSAAIGQCENEPPSDVLRQDLRTRCARINQLRSQREISPPKPEIPARQIPTRVIVREVPPLEALPKLPPASTEPKALAQLIPLRPVRPPAAHAPQRPRSQAPKRSAPAPVTRTGPVPQLIPLRQVRSPAAHAPQRPQSQAPKRSAPAPQRPHPRMPTRPAPVPQRPLK